MWLPHFIAPLFFDTRIYTRDFIDLQRGGSLEKAIEAGERVLIESCYDFGNHHRALSRNFIPRPDILAEVDQYVSTHFSTLTIGVHVRRTDNSLSIEQSPLSLFVDAMNHEIEKCPQVRFYIASDDSSTKEELRRIFGDKILTIDTLCDRNSATGMKDAVKEMWILSRTSHIYGCFYSSYSVIASQIGNIPLTILQIDNRVND